MWNKKSKMDSIIIEDYQIQFPWHELRALWLAFIPLCLFLGCKTSKQSISKSGDQPQSHIQESNNVIISSSDRSSSSGGATKVIFEGENNLIELVNQNSHFFNEPHDVIVIQGNGNLIKLYSIDLVSYRQEGIQYMIVGDDKKYVYFFNGEPELNSEAPTVSYAELKEAELDFNELAAEIDKNSEAYEKIRLYESDIKQGNVEGYFHLAQIYDLGRYGVPNSPAKAIELYEFAAAKSHLPSIRKLGDIWYNGGFDYKVNMTKGIYYYKLGASLGDEYCNKVLIDLK